MSLSEEQQMIRDMVREFAERELAPEADRIDRSEEFPKSAIDKAAELGLLGIPIAEEYGGAGCDLVAFCLAIEELGRACASTAYTILVHTALGTWPVGQAADPQLRQELLPRLASGQLLGTLALSEPQSDGDPTSIQTRATSNGGGWLLEGDKSFVSNGSRAGLILVGARTGDEHDSIDLFVVETEGQTGIEVTEKINQMGFRGADTVHLSFRGCRAETRLTNDQRGSEAIKDVLSTARLGMAALAVGISQAAFERSVRHASERQQFGRAISKFQAVSNMIAEMATDIAAARCLVLIAARLQDSGEPARQETAMAKLFAAEAAMRVTHKAVQIHGGYGFTRDYVVERLYREAKLTEIDMGSNETQKRIIAGEVLSKL